MGKSCILFFAAVMGMATGVAQAADIFIEPIQPPLERALGRGHSALWILSDVATQYQPLQLTPALKAALQAQQEGRFLEALILLEDAAKQVDASGEINLLRASFLLQGEQTQPALEILTPLLADSQHAAHAHALVAMAYLQQGKMHQALDVAKHAHDLDGNELPHLVLSYALQGAGRLKEAHKLMHDFNKQPSASSITLARDAELALTLNRVQEAKGLINQAQETANPYVIAVGGLVYLLDGDAGKAKRAFETALQRDPHDARALFGLGLAEIMLKNLPAGQKKLQAAHESDPGNALILTYLGRSQQQAGDIKAALASWRKAQQADPNDPAPWLYLAQADLQSNRLTEARNSLREAEVRITSRNVYRGEMLLNEDRQILLANLAEIQRLLGMEGAAFQTLNSSSGEKNSANLRNQADVLQGQRFAESARRSLLLQSMFNERPGTLPSELDIYGDGAGQTGAAAPQHGAVSALTSKQASYNSYDQFFADKTTLVADATGGSRNNNGEQVRLGAGNDILGISLAQRKFRSDGYAPFENLNNSIAQGTLQWRPASETQLFYTYQTFNSRHGETFQPAMPWGNNMAIQDDSRVTRLGLRHSLTDNSEIRTLLSSQQTLQKSNFYDLATPPNFLYPIEGNSNAHSEELQYRHSGAVYVAQWGMQQFRGKASYWYPAYLFGYDTLQYAQQYYFNWQQTFDPSLQLEAGLDWKKIERQDGTGGTHIRLANWLPRVGAVYMPDSVTHLRFATWQGMGTYAVGDATLTPVSIAGILMTRPGDNDKLVRAFNLGYDRQFSPFWLLDAKMQRRKTDQPYINFASGQQALQRQQIDESSMALHWKENSLAVKLAWDYERIYNQTYSAPDSVNEQNLRAQQLELRWFASEQFTANLSLSHNLVYGTQNGLDAFFNPVFLPYRERFNQLDAGLRWQLSKGALTAGMRNATGKSVRYFDIDPLNPRFSNGRLIYANVRLTW